MANLAELWGWMPDAMDRMEIGDLMEWYQHAVERNRKASGK